VVLNQQRTVFQGKFLHAPFEAFRLFFNVFVVTWGWREVRHRLSAAILKMNLIRHAVEVPAGITNKSWFYGGKFAGHAVDGFVRQILGFGASAATEDGNQTAPDVFILLSGNLAIRIKPTEQGIKGLLCQQPILVHDSIRSKRDDQRGIVPEETRWCRLFIKRKTQASPNKNSDALTIMRNSGNFDGTTSF